MARASSLSLASTQSRLVAAKLNNRTIRRRKEMDPSDASPVSYLFTADLNAEPALNLGAMEAGILIFWVGFWGLTPVRAALATDSKDPKPWNVTLSPATTAPSMPARRDFNAISACFLLMPASLAMRSTAQALPLAPLDALRAVWKTEALRARALRSWANICHDGGGGNVR